MKDLFICVSKISLIDPQGFGQIVIWRFTMIKDRDRKMRIKSYLRILELRNFKFSWTIENLTKMYKKSHFLTFQSSVTRNFLQPLWRIWMTTRRQIQLDRIIKDTSQDWVCNFPWFWWPGRWSVHNVLDELLGCVMSYKVLACKIRNLI